jgi:hypothetical protein
MAHWLLANGSDWAIILNADSDGEIFVETSHSRISKSIVGFPCSVNQQMCNSGSQMPEFLSADQLSRTKKWSFTRGSFFLHAWDYLELRVEEVSSFCFHITGNPSPNRADRLYAILSRQPYSVI